MPFPAYCSPPNPSHPGEECLPENMVEVILHRSPSVFSFMVHFRPCKQSGMLPSKSCSPTSIPLRCYGVCIDWPTGGCTTVVITSGCLCENFGGNCLKELLLTWIGEQTLWKWEAESPFGTWELFLFVASVCLRFHMLVVTINLDHQWVQEVHPVGNFWNLASE